MSTPTPFEPAPIPPVPAPVPVLPTDVLSSLTGWVTTVGAIVIADGLKQLLTAEPELIQAAMGRIFGSGSPFASWANGWMEQVRTDYAPGGELAATITAAATAAAHNFHVFMPNPDGTPASPEQIAERLRGWSPLPMGDHEGEAKPTIGVGDDLPDAKP